jgi:glycine cleavage system H protein
MNPTELSYSKEHEWVRIEQDGSATIGITAFAAEALGDVVFVDLPDAGSALTQFEKFGEIESVKAVSDLFSPIGGMIAEINQGVVDNPQLVNDGAFEGGWLLRVTLSNQSELDTLMSAAEYETFVASEGN